MCSGESVWFNRAVVAGMIMVDSVVSYYMYLAQRSSQRRTEANAVIERGKYVKSTIAASFNRLCLQSKPLKRLEK